MGGRKGGEGVGVRGMGADLLHSGASIHRAALVPVWVVSHPILRNKGSLAHLSRLQHMILIINNNNNGTNNNNNNNNNNSSSSSSNNNLQAFQLIGLANNTNARHDCMLSGS